MRASLLVFLAIGACACGSSSDQGGDAGSTADSGPTGDAAPQNDSGGSGDGGSTPDGSSGTSKVVFVIPMENKGMLQIYNDTTDAPYITGTLLKNYAHTINFGDELPSLNSEPHYIWMESGTNAFSDHTFTTDNDSSSSNSTSSTAHLSTQLDAANISWTSYQEDMKPGTCPIGSNVSTTSFYATKHNPFVFFQDVSGAPPSASNARCIAHHKPITALAADLKNSAVAQFNFVTPNLCHDMHGDANCTQGTATAGNIKAGDDWLKANLQPIVDYALAHDGYVFITWDEGDSTNLIPFIAIGKHSIAGHPGSVQYTHSSMLKSEEEILGVPVLSTVTSANDFADLFDPGTFP
ncbi:MAG TPA: alkaline phosphatase family protein [Polyangiaceae bacterium]|nr:alkaline phosphatase family protein [Polyangiaceae bacterium]